MNDKKIRIIRNQEEINISCDELIDRSKQFKNVYLDVGAGDSRFLYSIAKKHSDIFCISIDANPDLMRYASWKVSRKPSKGGLMKDNLFFLVSAIENLPKGLREIGDKITINYPWGLLTERSY